MRNKYSDTPIPIATQKRISNLVRVMLDHDKNLQFIDQIKGYTLLYYAARDGTPEVCKVIIETDDKIISVKEKESGMTPLLSDNYNAIVFKFLLELSKAKDIHCADMKQNTILHYCMRNILLHFRYIGCSFGSIWLQSSIAIINKDLCFIHQRNSSIDVPLVYALHSEAENKVKLNSICHSFGPNFLMWNMYRWNDFYCLLKYLQKPCGNLTIKTEDGQNFLHLLADCYYCQWLNGMN